MFLTTLFCVLIPCIYLWWRHVKLRRRIKDLPPLYPGAWPILGHSLLFINNSNHDHIWNLMTKSSEIVTKNGGVMTVFIGESLYFLLTDPDDSDTIANKCSEKNYLYNFSRPWLGTGLLTGNGETWKRHRKLLNPAFSQQVLNSFIDIFNVQAKQLVKDLEVEVGQAFDHIPYLGNLSLETGYQTTIGIDFEKDSIINKDSYIDTVKDICNIVLMRFQRIWLHNEFIYKWSDLKKRQDISIKIMKDTCNEVMNVKRTAAKRNEVKTDSKFKVFMDLLMELSDNGSLSDEEVCDEVNTFIIAGYETTASALTITLILLGSYPDVQNKVYKELMEVFDNSCRDVDKIDLTKLVYLEVVIKECLRYCPITPAAARLISHDVKLKHYTLPANTSCVFLVNGLHRHPVWGSDVNQFRPERWLEGSLPRNAFGIFGLGKRHCIGKTYAMMFIKTVLAHTLREYRIIADASKMTMKYEVVLKPYSDYFISIEKRLK